MGMQTIKSPPMAGDKLASQLSEVQLDDDPNEVIFSHQDLKAVTISSPKIMIDVSRSGRSSQRNINKTLTQQNFNKQTVKSPEHETKYSNAQIEKPASHSDLFIKQLPDVTKPSETNNKSSGYETSQASFGFLKPVAELDSTVNEIYASNNKSKEHASQAPAKPIRLAYPGSSRESTETHPTHSQES